VRCAAAKPRVNAEKPRFFINAQKISSKKLVKKHAQMQKWHLLCSARSKNRVKTRKNHVFLLYLTASYMSGYPPGICRKGGIRIRWLWRVSACG
jgi:hypothetical protein